MLFIKTKDVQLPAGNKPAFVVAHDPETGTPRVFKVYDTENFRAAYRVESKELLETECEGIQWRGPRVPALEIQRALSFFREVHSRWRTEALVHLYLDPKTHEITVEAPPQRVSVARCEFEATPTPEGLRHFGTMHSHHNMDAFHSDSDTAQELTAPGLYIVVGRIHDPYPSFSPIFAVDRTKRFPLNPGDVLDWAAPADEWMSRVIVEGASPVRTAGRLIREVVAGDRSV